MKRPSLAQAKRIAFHWGSGRPVIVGSHDPTIDVLVREGWIVPNGKSGTYPSGEPFEEYQVSAAGLAALKAFLKLDGEA